MSRPQNASAPWGRQRLILTLAAGVAVALVFVTGLVWAIVAAVTAHPDAAPAAPGVESASQRRDRIASAPMRATSQGEAFGGTPSLVPFEQIRIPEPAEPRGPAGVPTGFPRTPEGAIGQLAAIEVTVLSSMNLVVARDVHAAWSLPGGVEVADWGMTRNVQSFLSRLGEPGGTKPAGVRITVVPVGALVKGTDGPDWVLACVLTDVEASAQRSSRMGYGYCERMQWTDGRWLIAPGVAPATAPHAWPGSQVAHEAGWRTWVSVGAVG